MLVGLALAAACSFSFEVGRSKQSWAERTGGVEPTPLAVLDTADGPADFRVYSGAEGSPCVAHEIPSSAGGTCLVAVANGTELGWAVEPWTKQVGDTMVVYGAAIPPVTTLRVHTVAGTQVVPTTEIEGFEVRWFAFVAQARLKHSNAVTALDAKGDVVGRPHNNVGTSRRPDFGDYDGWWDARQPQP